MQSAMQETLFLTKLNSVERMSFHIPRKICSVLIFLSITYILMSCILWLFSSSEDEIRLENVSYNQQTTGQKQIISLTSILIDNLSRKNPMKSENVLKDESNMKMNETVDKEMLSESESEDSYRKKVKSLILSNWRSGSSFFGGIFHSLPESFYSFEPLMYLGTEKIHDSAHLAVGLETIRHILQCNYTGLDDYFQFRGYKFGTSHNSLLWKSCKSNRTYCSDPTYVSTFCKTMTYHIIKVVRLLVEHSEALLKDLDSNLKIILLIRDPRGIMHSRNREVWCKGYCENVTHLCNDMVADFKAAKKLYERYPKRFTVLRYEDLSMNPFNVTKKVFQFNGLPFHEDVKKFLNSHTQKNEGHSLSLFRHSKTTPFRWVKEMTFAQIQSIQSVCSEAMSLWRYKTLTEEDLINETDFDPLLKFPFRIDNY